VYIKHPLRCEHSAPPSCLCCDSQSILVAYADGFLGSASWLGKVGRCCGDAAQLQEVVCKHALHPCSVHSKQGCLHHARCSEGRATTAEYQQANSSHATRRHATCLLMVKCKQNRSVCLGHEALGELFKIAAVEA
jgi:hypothetical protein